MTDFAPLSHTSTSEIPTLSYTWLLKKGPLSDRASRIDHYREYPSPRASHHANLIQCCFADKFFQLAWEDIHWDNAYTCKLSSFSEKSQVESEESEFKLWNITRLRKQLTFCDATTDLQAKRRLRNRRRNSILMTRHYPDLGSASDWLKKILHAARPIRSSTQLWVVTRLQYGISALVSQTSFCW